MAISQSDKIWLILDNRLIEGAPEDLMIAGAFDHLFNSSQCSLILKMEHFPSGVIQKAAFSLKGQGETGTGLKRQSTGQDLQFQKKKLSLPL